MEMESRLAKLIGAPYEARQVQFTFPEFIDIIVAAGDHRNPTGSTIGESLPNWGYHAEKGNSRTVAMTNYYTDRGSIERRVKRAGLLFDETSLARFNPDRNSSIIATILHEAAHNLGPNSGYLVNGKSMKEIFGPNSSVMSELQAQTAVYYYLPLLYENKLLTEAELNSVYTGNIYWCFGHLSKGYFSSDDIPNAYAQLCGIQIGRFIEDQAVKVLNNSNPETGDQDRRFEIDYTKIAQSGENLMKDVSRIRATGDEKAGLELIEHYIKGKGSRLIPLDEINKKYCKFPYESFYFTAKLGKNRKLSIP